MPNTSLVSRVNQTWKTSINRDNKAIKSHVLVKAREPCAVLFAKLFHKEELKPDDNFCVHALVGEIYLISPKLLKLH